MVFFNCNACGETLKRNKVEIHYRTKCRSCEVLSCVDCSKEFWGDDYKQHMTCISEEEKYSGSNYVAKPNKGEVKQELWQKSIADAVEKHKNNFKMKDLLTRLIEHPNIPRKQKKFENFMRSSFGVRDNKCISEIWSIISSSTSSSNGASENGSTNGQNKTTTEDCEPPEKDSKETDENIQKLSKREKKEQRRLLNDKKEKKDRTKHSEATEEDTSKKKKKKRKKKNDDSEIEEENEEDGEVENKRKRLDESEESEEEKVVKKRKIKFSWEKVIEEVLNTKGEEIPLKKLRKKVLAEYASQGGCLESEDELSAKFMKKLTKNPKFKVLKERVKLAKSR
ncbi:hypothetical protein LOTGIDRAFT_206535 [Lottia gigantea]|uniref:Uncharacterized protein n=1 Tax=Lottia gigantea TaxID=225164 RepID=V4BVJ8_LOTGI|nr:hypothetical protein LOTGIDRAFT_206535 [Lottia gigantea]ESO93049.1 hypothetical protein LOTGIDRAFT_206535 [Lottia gigantea]